MRGVLATDAVMTRWALALALTFPTSCSIEQADQNETKDESTSEQRAPKRDKTGETLQPSGAGGYMIYPQRMTVDPGPPLVVTGAAKAVRPLSLLGEVSPFEGTAWAVKKVVVDGIVASGDVPEWTKASRLGSFAVDATGAFVGEWQSSPGADDVLVLVFGGNHGVDVLNFIERDRMQASVYVVETKAKILTRAGTAPPKRVPKPAEINETIGDDGEDDDGIDVPDLHWRLSDVNRSCIWTCTDYGGVDESALIDFAGTGGTIEQCGAVAKLLGKGAKKPKAEEGFFSGLGCAYRPSKDEVVYFTQPVTTADALAVGVQRFCPCRSKTAE